MANKKVHLPSDVLRQQQGEGEGLLNKRKSNLSPLLAYQNTLFIKLPRQNEEKGSELPASLYEANLRRLKKQRSNVFKNIRIPSINQNHASLQPIERPEYRKIIKNSELPEAHTVVPKSIKRHADYLSFIEEKHEETSQLLQRYTKRQEGIGDRATIEGTTLGFKNLKEKYLTLHEKSIDGKRWSQLLERNSKSTMETYSFSQSLHQHLERYKKKEQQNEEEGIETYQHSFFKPRLRGNNSIFVPRAQQRKVQKFPLLQNQEISTFAKRKQLNNPTVLQSKTENSSKRSKFTCQIFQKREDRLEDEYKEGFTPWETQPICD